ncbi:MAG: HD domain-containing protein [Anaerolineae bacterium]|nr:HD domain-containing protein [Anaerolineae bacterium]
MSSSDNYYHLLLEDHFDLICRWLPDGKLTLVNPKFYEFLGKPKGELVDFDFFDIIIEEQRKDIKKKISSLTPNNPKIAITHPITNGNGTLIWQSWTHRAIFENGGVNPVEIQSIGRDVTLQKKQEREREILFGIAASLRGSTNKFEITRTFINQLNDLMDTKAVAVILKKPEDNSLVVENSVGEWRNARGLNLEESGRFFEPMLKSGSYYLNNNIESEEDFPLRRLNKNTTSILSLRLTAQEEAIGLIVVGFSRSISEQDVVLLTPIADMAANTIYSAFLYEQTQLRLHRLKALHTIDQAITSNKESRAILKLLLEQITIQQEVDAADILLVSNKTQLLEFTAQYGFNTNALQHTKLKLGQGYAGKAASERKVLFVPSLKNSPGEFIRAKQLAKEGFESYYAVPLISNDVVIGVLEVFHRTPLEPEAEWESFLLALATQTAIALDRSVMIDELQNSNNELIQAYEFTLEGWARALELRNKETEGHTRRVTEITVRLAEAMHVDEAELVNIRRGALLHDIGKIAVPDSILNKPDSLSDEEEQIMRRHPLMAYEMLSHIEFLKPALDIPYCHHEKWDGTGYPRGLKGEDIPLSARIFAIIDVWDALRTNRPYREAWPEDNITRYIREQSGKHFDPAIVDAFFEFWKNKTSPRP